MPDPVEIVAAAIHNYNRCGAQSTVAEVALAALSDAGYSLYRPADCEMLGVAHGEIFADPQTGEPREAEPILHGPQIQATRCRLDSGTYHLVKKAN